MKKESTTKNEPKLDIQDLDKTPKKEVQDIDMTPIHNTGIIQEEENLLSSL